MQIKIHPLFFALAAALVAFGHGFTLIWTLLALTLHELAHALMARLRGFVVKKAVLLPYGAMMSLEENFDRTSSVLVGLAGPICNLVLALCVLGVWWLFPRVYPYTQDFLYANLSLGLFNLLPIYPLDGSRVALGVAKNRLKAIKAMQLAGVIVSIIMFALFILSFFFGFSLSLGIMAVFLFYGAAFGTREEMYSSVLLSLVKNYAAGVTKKQVIVLADTPIVRLFHHVGVQYETEFLLTDKRRIIAKLSEEELRLLAVKYKLSTPVYAAYSGKAPQTRPRIKKDADKVRIKRR